MSRVGCEQVLTRAMVDAAFRHELRDDPLAALAGFDLDDAERDWFVLPNFRWQEPGRIAGVGWPGSDAALARLAALGVRALISLTEAALPAERLSRHGLRAVHLPLADFAAPDVDHIAQVMAAIDTFLEQGQPVAIHCVAGLGRTGTLLACRLVSGGLSAEAAIAAVRAAQPGAIETAAQEAAVAAYANCINARG